MAERNFSLEIAKVIGEPIDPNLPVAPALAEIADFDTAKPGEDVKRYPSEDSNADDAVYSVGAGGVITVQKITPQTPTVLTFTGMQSRLEYVLVDEVMNSEDQDALGRRKAAIARAMDKKELKEALDLILGVAGQEVTQASGEDIFDVIIKMKHLIEDYGDNYVLLCGTSCKEKLDSYDKDNVTTFNYKAGLKEFLADSGIKVIKIVGTYSLDGGSQTRVLATDKMILVARNSTIAQGKPLSFVRRLISSEIAASMGAEVDKAQRALIVVPTPVVVSTSSLNTLAYGVYAYESRINALLNFRATCWATVA